MSDVGPSTWGKCFPLCNGHKQNPIDIVFDNVRYNEFLRNLRLTNFDDSITRLYHIINNGHTVVVNLVTQTTVPTLFSPITNSEYRMAQFHYHWGPTDYEGSETFVNGAQFPLEVRSSSTN